MARINPKIANGNFVPYHVVLTDPTHRTTKVESDAEIVLSHNNPYIISEDRARKNLADISDPETKVCYVCKLGGAGTGRLIQGFVDDSMKPNEIAFATFIVIGDQVYRRMSARECDSKSASGFSKKLGPMFWKRNGWAREVFKDKWGIEGFAWPCKLVHDSEAMIAFIGKLIG